MAYMRTTDFRGPFGPILDLEAQGYSLHVNLTLSLRLFHFINILLYSELPRYPNKNSHNETNEKGSGAHNSLSGAPLRSNTKNHYQFLAEVEGFLSMLHS